MRHVDWAHDLLRPLADAFGRVATDLRVSLTDRCNLRCSYCMPAEGLDWLPNDEVLTDDEVVRLITIAVERLGVRGGALHRRRAAAAPRAARHRPSYDGAEPATRDLDHHQRARARPAPRRRSPRPASTGSTSASTRVRPEDFHTITRRDRFARRGRGPGGRRRTPGLGPVKVNAVLLRGVNDDQAPELLRWCLERGYELRFIEQMPLDAQHGWSREAMVTADEIFASLRHRVRARARPRSRGAARRPSCSPSTAARTPSA